MWRSAAVRFAEDDVYVIVTPRGKEIHVTRMMALTVQAALIFGQDLIQDDHRMKLYTWLDQHAVRPYLDTMICVTCGRATYWLEDEDGAPLPQDPVCEGCDVDPRACRCVRSNDDDTVVTSNDLRRSGSKPT